MPRTVREILLAGRQAVVEGKDEIDSRIKDADVSVCLKAVDLLDASQEALDPQKVFRVAVYDHAIAMAEAEEAEAARKRAADLAEGNAT